MSTEIIDIAEEYGLLVLPTQDNFKFEGHNYDEVSSPLLLLKTLHSKTNKITNKILTLGVLSKIDSLKKAIAW